MLVEASPVGPIAAIFEPDKLGVYNRDGNIRLVAKSGKTVVNNIHPIVWLRGLVYIEGRC